MKTSKRFVTGILIFLATACHKPGQEKISAALPFNQDIPDATKPVPIIPLDPVEVYQVKLESRHYNGTGWEWIWSIYNTNSGNGENGTIQDLAHWGIQFTPCFNQASLDGAAYSADGITWTNFDPLLEPDPTQGCLHAAVLKFDLGTLGPFKSYYKIVVNEDYPPGPAVAYYKSGNLTGCGRFTFIGIGCAGEPEEGRMIGIL